MEDTISMEEKEERLQILNHKVADYALMHNKRFEGQTVEVLVDGISKRNKEVYSGYTPENKLVNFTGRQVEIGSLVKVKINSAMSFSLNGELVEE